MHNKLSLTLFILFSLIFQTSCVSNFRQLVARENSLRARDDFNAYLAREYLQYSRDLANKNNWRDSNYFAKKGLDVANNQEFYPEVAENWGLNFASSEEVAAARARLQLLLSPKVKQILPIHLAHLSLLFDCWISNEEKSWNLGGLFRCKTRFLKLMAEIENYMTNIQAPQEVVIFETKDPEFKKFEVYFDFDSYKFNSSANREFFELIDYLGTLNGDFRILLFGNADRKGKPIYNDALARKRVLITKEMLIKNGVPADLIDTKSFGENVPQIITKEDQRNKYNRVVGVYVLKGYDSISTIPLPLIDHYIYEKEIKNKKQNKDLENNLGEIK